MFTTSHDMTLEPLRDESTGDEYHAARPKSLFRLRSKRPRLPSGWVLVSGVWGRAGPPSETVLMADSGGGEPDRYPLPARGDPPVMIRLPRRVCGLTLSTTTCIEEVQLRGMRIMQLGPLRTARELLRAYVEAVARDPAMVAHFVLRGASMVRRHGVRGLRTALVARFPRAAQATYGDWVRRYDTLAPADAAAIRAHIEVLPARPRFCIVLPVGAASPSQIDAAVGAVRSQWYEEWELLVAVTG